MAKTPQAVQAATAQNIRQSTGTPNVKSEEQPTIAAQPTTVEDQTIGLDVKLKLSPEQHAAQRAAMNEWQRRSNPGRYTNLPNGQIVEVRGSVLHKYPGAKKTILMAKPELIIHAEFRRPDFGESMPRYQWRCRIDSSTSRRDLDTANLHRRGIIRYVEIGEIDRDSPYAQIEEYAVPGAGNNVYVIMDTAILCEILDPNQSYEQYKYWQDLALSNVAELPDVVMSYGDTHIQGKTATGVSMKDARQGS